jgi:hypothetical protein
MIADAILDCSSRGDIVLDNFSGVGSTLLAAEVRNLFGIGRTRQGERCYNFNFLSAFRFGVPLYAVVLVWF